MNGRKTREFSLFADEAWTHTSRPLNRYWNFFGGVLGPTASTDRLTTKLKKVVRRHDLRSEIKWSNLSAQRLRAYRELVDVFFGQLANDDLRYRQFFTSREYVPCGVDISSDLDVQFKLYYQFLKNSFSFGKMPPSSRGETTNVLLRLDTHSSEKHKKRLQGFVEGLPNLLGLASTSFRVKFVPSERFLPLQLCDLLMGAAGSHGNRMHKIRQPGQRGMTPRQEARHKLATFIYKKLRELDAAERGTSAFNWFESTGGRRGWSDTLRIWKFRPSRYQLDRGWRNDNLGPAGEYVSAKIDAARIYNAKGEPIDQSS